MHFGSILIEEIIGFADDIAYKGEKKKSIMVIEFLALVTELIVMPFAEVEKGVGRENNDVEDMLNLRLY